MPTPAQVQAAVEGLSNTGKLVHLAWRFDSVHEQRISATIFQQLRRNFEDELTRQARAVGCNQRRGMLSEGPTLTELRRIADEHARSIMLTYNLDLAHAIAAVRTEVPTANRHTYSSRLRRWENARAQWKEPQISLNTHQIGAQMGREEFLRFNDIQGQAIFAGPDPAAEPECQALLDGNPWSLRKIHETPTPIHINCPHRWDTQRGKLASGDCASLWMGG